MNRNLIAAVASFAISSSFHLFAGLIFGIDSIQALALILFAAIFPFLVNSLLFFSRIQVALRASLLGTTCALGALVSLNETYPTWNYFGWYMAIFSLFHWSEYVATAMTSPSTLSLDSFILNHSVQYWIAATASWVEFSVEVYFFPQMKNQGVISSLGLFLCIVGDGLRKMGMFTAGSNFTHLVSYHKQPGHVLVTRGVYSIFRHPSYVGWFWWSIGTQVILCNPICSVAYAIASWTFFNERIQDEELALIRFFGEEYVYYKERVPTGLPFIRGYVLED